MNKQMAIGACIAAAYLWIGPSSAATPPAAAAVKGVVLETMNSGGYTYLRLKTKDAETWAAVNRAMVKKGASVTIENALVMTDFESKSLKRTFPTIVFGRLGEAGQPAAGASAWSMVQPGPAKPRAEPEQAVAGADARVAKAVGANARTVEEVVAKGAQLKDKPVLVRAKVVKYNAGIMGKNWLHLRDGTGSEAAGSNDLLATSAETASVGEVVTVQGNVRTDKDFGAGYFYKVLIEDAKLSR